MEEAIKYLEGKVKEFEAIAHDQDAAGELMNAVMNFTNASMLEFAISILEKKE